ncbi:hypothetical protein K8I28_10605 [bacterium]|nr:hypothetical protein [bacterium]
MRVMLAGCILFLFISNSSAIEINSEELGDALSNLNRALSGISIEGVMYLSYADRKDPVDNHTSEFSIRRSYLTVVKDFSDYVHARLTLDSHMDDEGDMEVRLKYAYIFFTPDDLGFISNQKIEFGMVHTPWLDFEQNLNYYRMRDKMYMERAGMFNSADFGFTVFGYFGGEMDDSYKKKVNKKYAGRFGSYAFGLYNGGGYHAEEANENKVMEARVTVRPLPETVSGMQLSYFVVNGKGNLATNPDWIVHTGMFSYEHQYMTLTGLYVTGEGNQSGGWSGISSSGVLAKEFEGYSVFVEGKPDEHWRVLGGYDVIEVQNLEANNWTEFHGGIGYKFNKGNLALFDYTVRQSDFFSNDDRRLQFTIQVKF